MASAARTDFGGVHVVCVAYGYAFYGASHHECHRCHGAVGYASVEHLLTVCVFHSCTEIATVCHKIGLQKDRWLYCD